MSRSFTKKKRSLEDDGGGGANEERQHWKLSVKLCDDLLGYFQGDATTSRDCESSTKTHSALEQSAILGSGEGGKIRENQNTNIELINVQQLVKTYGCTIFHF